MEVISEKIYNLGLNKTEYELIIDSLYSHSKKFEENSYTFEKAKDMIHEMEINK